MSFSEQEIEEFKAEALELLDVAEKSLLSLDAGAELTSAFDAVFRGFHNLKGAAGVMELTKLQAHTHELENILMGFKGAGSIPKEYISLFLRGIDAAKVLLANGDIQFNYSVSSASVADTPTQPTPDEKQDVPNEALNEFFVECEELVERISACLQSVEAGDSSRDCVDGLYRDIHSLKGSAYLFSYTKLGDLAHAMESSLEKVRAGTHMPSKNLLNGLFKSLAMIERLVQSAKVGTSNSEIEAAVPKIAVILQTIAERLDKVPEEKPSSAAQQAVPKTEETVSPPKEKDTESTNSIRVSVALLDNLMTLMGEMVLVRNQVLQFSNRSEDLEFLSMSKRLNVVTSEIQGEMMKTRMQPIGNILSKFNRVVRGSFPRAR